MKFKLNPFSGFLDLVDAIASLWSSDPSSADEGTLIVNTSTNELKIYYAGSWQVIATLTGAGSSYILLENGDRLLLESGDLALLE